MFFFFFLKIEFFDEKDGEWWVWKNGKMEREEEGEKGENGVRETVMWEIFFFLVEFSKAF